MLRFFCVLRSLLPNAAYIIFLDELFICNFVYTMYIIVTLIEVSFLQMNYILINILYF